MKTQPDTKRMVNADIVYETLRHITFAQRSQTGALNPTQLKRFRDLVEVWRKRIAVDGTMSRIYQMVEHEITLVEPSTKGIS